MNSPNHILFITPGFTADENDSVTIPPLQVYLKAYQKRYPEVLLSIIALQYPFEEKVYKWNDINVYCCGGKNKRGIAKFRTWRKAEKYFKNISRSHKPDLIHSFWLNEAAGLGNYFSKKLRIKHIVTLMGQDACDSNRYLKLLDLNYPQLVTLSNFQKEVLRQTYYKANPEVIPWGIEPDEFNYLKENRYIDILGAGSLIPLKQFNLFIKIVEAVKKEHPNVKAAIAGKGPEIKHLLRLIAAAGLSQNIELKGELSRPDLLELMHQSKIFLHTSNYESQAYVLQEALAAGTKVVSTRVGIAGELPEIMTADSEDELKNIILNIWNKEEYKPVIPVSIEETINAYQQIYSK